MVTLNISHNCWSWRTLLSSSKILSEDSSMGSTLFHISRVALQRAMLCQQGCLRHSAMAHAGPAGPRLCFSPGPATPRAWGGLVARPGQAGGAEVAFPEGQSRSLTRGCGLPWWV